MNTYALLSGEVIEYPDQPAAVNNFLARVVAAVNDPNTTPAEVLALAYGVENPLLDTTTQPGRAIVTKAVFEHPVYRIFGDLVGRKQMLISGHTLEELAAPYTVSVADAAKQLGLTESAVRIAISQRKLSGMKRNGEWYLRPESIASYKVSNRGRGRKKATARANPATPNAVSVRSGTEADGSGLFVRIDGDELVIEQKDGNITTAHFPADWTRAVVKTTVKTDGGSVRVFEIEPATDAAEKIEHHGLFVSGPFRIAKKHNATAAALKTWKQYASEKAAS